MAPQMVRGDHLWQPYLHGPGDHPQQHIYFAEDGPVGPILGGPSVA